MSIISDLFQHFSYSLSVPCISRVTFHVPCAVLKAVERINAAIREGVPEKTVEELMNPDAQLPEVYPSAADLYQRELVSLQQQSPEVHTHTKDTQIHRVT